MLALGALELPLLEVLRKRELARLEDEARLLVLEVIDEGHDVPRVGVRARVRVRVRVRVGVWKAVSRGTTYSERSCRRNLSSLTKVRVFACSLMATVALVFSSVAILTIAEPPR